MDSISPPTIPSTLTTRNKKPCITEALYLVHGFGKWYAAGENRTSETAGTVDGDVCDDAIDVVS